MKKVNLVHKQVVPRKRYSDAEVIREVERTYREFWNKNKLIRNVGKRDSVHGVEWVRSNIPRQLPYSGHQTDLGT